MNDHDVGQFFDSLTSDYTETIERCFPRYREMLWALLDYLPTNPPVQTILELGCGTGNLSVLLRDVFPEATLHVVDVSRESLDVCRLRLGAGDRCVFTEQDIRRLDYSANSFDLIVSSIAIHHLVSSEKQILFRKCHDWLGANGVLSFADQCAGATRELYEHHMQNWQRQSLEAGSTPEEWAMWMRHQADHDHHDTLFEHLAWLRDAGFPIVDCTWRYLLWSVIQARP